MAIVALIISAASVIFCIVLLAKHIKAGKRNGQKL